MWAIGHSLFSLIGFSRPNSPRSGSCDIRNTISFNITVECDFDLVITGFEVIVQLNDFSKMHKLYVNQSNDLQSEVIVPVEEPGEHYVSIFAFASEMGIVDSSVIYEELVYVGDTMSVGTTSVGDTTSGGDTLALPLSGI
jgi:hypothetical protein